MIEESLRWGILIRGHDFDIRSWRLNFMAPFDPYVSDTDHGPTLWSEAIQDAANATEAFERAKGLVQSINSVMFHTTESRLIEIDSIIEVKGGGRPSKHIASVAKIESRSYVAGVGQAINTKNEIIEEEPAPSKQQKWLKAAEDSELLSDLLTHGFHRRGWYEIYKAIEVLEFLYGGEKGLVQFAGEYGKKIKDLKHTANFYHRHARGEFKKPKSPVELADAQKLLTKMIRRAFDKT